MNVRRTAAAVLVFLLCAVAVAGAAGLGGIGSSPEAARGMDIQFREVANETGFEYNTSQPSGIMSEAGVYAADYDRDGWTDLLAVGAERSGPVLFDNHRGEFSPTGHLDEIEREIRAAIFVDYDADADDDIVLFPWAGEPIVMENTGDGFDRAPDLLNVDLARPVGGTVGDYNGDGCLDLFVIQNGDWTDRLPEETDSANVSPTEDNGNRNLLFRGTCDGFENVTREAGIRGETWTLASSMVDLDGDGRQDIHVANDFNNDVIYWNDGDGTFTQQVLPNETNRNAMASEVLDVNGDGRLDIFVTNIYLPDGADGSVVLLAEERSDGNNLLVNEGDREFATAGERCGVAKGGWGWAAVGADLDNDGDDDIFHSTLEFTLRLGMEMVKVRQTSPVYSYPVLFEQRSGPGCQFVRRNTSEAGFEMTDGHGVAQIDYDRDGDLDVAMSVSPGPTGDARYRLYENVGTDGKAVQVRLRGEGTTPYGARVFVEANGTGTQMRALHSRSDYFSQGERVLHFGIGNDSTADVRVVWPDGTEQAFPSVDADTRLVVTRDGIEQNVTLANPPTWPADATLDAALLFAVVAAFGGATLGYRRYRDGRG